MNQCRADQFYGALNSLQPLERFIQRKRDLVILDFCEDYYFILACDSNASIGQKEHDYVYHEWKEVGRSASKVPLMEVLAVGALPFVVVDNLCVEPDPAGLGILEGIRFEVQRLGLDPDLVITGSSEKNMLTTQTGLGVTVLGIVQKDQFKMGASQGGDRVVCVGIPKNAPQQPYLEGDPEIMDPPSVKKLRGFNFIHEVIPVGSHGILYEMEVLARDSGLRAVELNSSLPMDQSAGASTCVLASLPESSLPILKEMMDRPVNVVGYLE